MSDQKQPERIDAAETEEEATFRDLEPSEDEAENVRGGAGCASGEHIKKATL
jgi:hypothetical protein